MHLQFLSFFFNFDIILCFITSVWSVTLPPAQLRSLLQFNFIILIRIKFLFVPREVLSFIYYNLSNGRYVLAHRILLLLFILKINTRLAWNFSWTWFFRQHDGPGSNLPLTVLSSKGVSWGVKADCPEGWQPCHFHMPIVLKSWVLNLMEPSGPV